MTDQPEPVGQDERSASRVLIIGDHSHKGERGTVRDDLPMKMGMWLVELDRGPGPPMSHTDCCYAGSENLRPLDPSEDPYA